MYECVLWSNGLLRKSLSQDFFTPINPVSKGMVEETEVPGEKTPTFSKQNTDKHIQTRICLGEIRRYVMRGTDQ